MDISFKIEGLDKLQKASKGVAESINRELLIALDASARHVSAEMKRSIAQGPKTGRLYKRRTVTHQASAPGEAPASDTGRLVNSVATYLERRAKYAVITAGRGLARYARMLEFGTAKMAARPFFFVAVEKSRAWIQNRLNDAVIRAVMKALKK